MKEIPLTQGKVALVDDEDFEWLSKWKWSATKGRWRYYAVRCDKANRTIYMHRSIMNTAKGLEVDHKDGNGLNNQKDNMRNCTRSQNAQNIHTPERGSQGVHWNRGKKKFIAKIRVNYKTVHLGYFSTKEEAALKYNEAAIRLFGMDAQVNNVG